MGILRSLQLCPWGFEGSSRPWRYSYRLFRLFWTKWKFKKFYLNVLGVAEGYFEIRVGVGSSLVTLTFKRILQVCFRLSEFLLGFWHNHLWEVGWGKIVPLHWSHITLYLGSATILPIIVLGVLAFSTK